MSILPWLCVLFALCLVNGMPQGGKPKGQKRPTQPHVDGEGNFYWEFANPDGTAHYQTGFMKNPGTPDAVQVLQGAYTYFGPDGTLHLTQYTADEEGYKPTHLEMPLPEEHRKLVKY